MRYYRFIRTMTSSSEIEVRDIIYEVAEEQEMKDESDIMFLRA